MGAWEEEMIYYDSPIFEEFVDWYHENWNPQCSADWGFRNFCDIYFNGKVRAWDDCQ